MANELRFDGKVAIVTGAGNGLGRSHALLLSSRGAKVVVNDLGGGIHGAGASSAAADAVVEEIKKAGGEAVANYNSVEDGDKIVKTAVDAFGKVDILINNAGILRDTSFQKMSDADWDLILRVHVQGAYKCTKAVWDLMREQGYGRILMTASAAGIYGNFGQANYALAKIGLIGFAQTLALEGKKKNVHVNVIAPIAGSRMTETVLPPELIAALKPEYVSPLAVYLCHEDCKETGSTFEVGGGFIGKLRWERTAGKTFKLGKEIKPDDVAKAWEQITDFSKSEHPADITSSMQPILANIQSKSKGGNEHIDLDEALGYEFPEVQSSYDERDAALYALAIGAGQNPLDNDDLKFVYEMHGDGFQVEPTFGVIPVMRTMMEMAKKGEKAPGLNYGFDRILHGEQYTEVKRPLPANAKLKHKAKIKDIFDKGKNALVIQSVTSYDANTGEELIYNEFVTFVRGAGGWGGDRGPSLTNEEQNVAPERAPDAVITEKTSESQALLYRLTGDWNPLHADPSFAKAFGFEKPILHGLCTYGFVARHVIKQFAKNDARLFKSIKARFADSVFPGETLKTEMWVVPAKERTGSAGDKIIVRCSVVERNKVVISNAAVELYKEIPKAAAPKKEAPEAAANTGAPTSEEVFLSIGEHLKGHPEIAQKVQTTFAFKLTNPNSAYLVDLKDGKVVKGDAKADCTLEIAESDFLALTQGKADAQKLYFGGKLKISGNVMASQKLETLFKSMTPAEAEKLLAKVRAERGANLASEVGSDPPTTPAPSGEATSAEVFAAMGEFLKNHPEIAQKVQTTFAFNLKGPDASYLLDLKQGVVTPGGGKADCTLEISDADFMALTAGKADPQKLYFGGKLKISGNVMASQKLETLFKAMTPEESKKALDSIRSKGGAAPAAAAASSSSRGAQSKAIFDALSKRVAETPTLLKEAAAVINFKVKDPDAQYVVDLKTGKGSVKPGSASDATTTLTITDEDLVELVKGTASAQSLYQNGKLRVDGDVTVAHRLGFLNKLI